MRKLALRTALALKHAQGKLAVVAEEDLAAAAWPVESGHTKAMAARLAAAGWAGVRGGVLFCVDDGAEAEYAVAQRAGSNLRGVDFIPQRGLNVYDVLRHGTVVVTPSALDEVTMRLKKLR